MEEETEAQGNCAVGSVISLQGNSLAEAGNSMLVPQYNPIWHAEMMALSRIPIELWPRAREMTCYNTLEPCVAFTVSLLLHSIGRVVSGMPGRKSNSTSHESGKIALAAFVARLTSAGATSVLLLVL